MRHRRKYPGLVLVWVAAIVCSGCVTSVGPGAIAGPAALRSVYYPNAIQPNKKNVVKYSPELIEIVGYVQNRRNSSSLQWRLPFLGNRSIIAIKSSDYGSAVRELHDEYNIDGLLNRTIDTRRFVINFFLGRYSDYQTIIGGVGFRFRDEAVADRPPIDLGESSDLREEEKSTESKTSE